MRRFQQWLQSKWQRRASPELLQAYQVTFSTLHGKLVLQHWLDEVYCRICHSKDPIELATHNGRRSFVQEVLEAIDAAEQPGKYEITQPEEMNHDRVA